MSPNKRTLPKAVSVRYFVQTTREDTNMKMHLLLGGDNVGGSRTKLGKGDGRMEKLRTVEGWMLKEVLTQEVRNKVHRVRG